MIGLPQQHRLPGARACSGWSERGREMFSARPTQIRLLSPRPRPRSRAVRAPHGTRLATSRQAPRGPRLPTGPPGPRSPPPPKPPRRPSSQRSAPAHPAPAPSGGNRGQCRPPWGKLAAPYFAAGRSMEEVRPCAHEGTVSRAPRGPQQESERGLTTRGRL